MRIHLFRIIVYIALALMVWSCILPKEDKSTVLVFTPKKVNLDYQMQYISVSVNCKRSLDVVQFAVIADGKHYYESYDKTEVNTYRNPKEVDSSVPRYIKGPWFTVEIPASPVETLTVEIEENNKVIQRSLTLGGMFHVGECTITQEAHPIGQNGDI